MDSAKGSPDWVESPCEHVWVLEHGGESFCRLCLVDGPVFAEPRQRADACLSPAPAAVEFEKLGTRAKARRAG